MSYSISVKTATKAEAKQKIAKEWDSIVAQQPIHSADRKSAEATAAAFIDALKEPDAAEEISVSAYGSVSWRGDNSISALSGTVNAALVTKT